MVHIKKKKNLKKKKKSQFPVKSSRGLNKPALPANPRLASVGHRLSDFPGTLDCGHARPPDLVPLLLSLWSTGEALRHYEPPALNPLGQTREGAQT